MSQASKRRITLALAFTPIILGGFFPIPAMARRGFPQFMETEVSVGERFALIGEALFGGRSRNLAAAADAFGSAECGWWDKLWFGCDEVSPAGDEVDEAGAADVAVPKAAGGPSADLANRYFVTDDVIERVVVREEADPSATRALLERLGLLEAEVTRFDGRIDAINGYSPRSASRARNAASEDADASIADAVSGGSADASFGTLAVSGAATSTFGNGLDIADGCFAVDGVCLDLGSGADGAWSTTSAAYWDDTVSRWATTSNAYWESTQTRWATTSSAHWFTTKTTADLAESGNLYYTDARVAAYIAASSTVPHVGGAAYGDVLYWTGSAWSRMATSTLGIEGSKWDDATGGINYSGGNVGIGTTNPSTSLSIVNDSAYESFNTKHSNLTQGVAIGWQGIAKTGSSDNSHLYINAKGTGDLILQTIATGKVGIGTTSPSATLAVQGSGLISGDLSLANLTATGTATAGMLTVGSAVATSTFSTGGLTVGTSQFVVQQTSGKVGIGTTTPAYSLSLVSSGNVQAWIGTSGSFGYTIGRNTGTGYLDILGNQSGFQGINVDAIKSTGAITVGGNAVITNWSTTLGLGSGSGTPNAYLELRGTGTQLALGGGSGTNYTFSRNSSTGYLEIAGQQGSYTGYKFSTGNYTDAFTLIDGVGAVFNEAGQSVLDFRVEGDTNANLLFVDASADAVGIGTSTPSGTLAVVGSSSTNVKIYKGTSQSGAIFQLSKSDGTGSFRITEQTNNDFASSESGMLVNVGGTGRLILAATGNTVLGLNAHGSQAVQVRSDSLFGWNSGTTIYNGAVDTGLSRVSAGVVGVGTGSAGSSAGTLLATSIGVGTTTPAAPLAVAGNIYATGTISSVSSYRNTGFSASYTGSSGRNYQVLSCYDCGSAGLGGLEVYDATASAGRAYIAAGVNGWQTPSDLRLKSDIETLHVLDRIGGVRGVSYTLNDSGIPQIGVIAQEMREAFPEVVSGEEAEGRYLGVNYNGVAAISLQGVRELDERLESIAAAAIEEDESFSARFFRRLATWLADTGNGLASIFAAEVRTETLCLASGDGSSTCLTEGQLRELLDLEAEPENLPGDDAEDVPPEDGDDGGEPAEEAGDGATGGETIVDSGGAEEDEAAEPDGGTVGTSNTPAADDNQGEAAPSESAAGDEVSGAAPGGGEGDAGGDVPAAE